MIVPTLRDLESEIGRVLREQGALAAVLLDMGALARVERSFGEAAYQSLRSQIDPLLGELEARVREEDILVRDDRATDRVLLFLDRKRSAAREFFIADLVRMADRLEQQLGARVARLAQPYLREKPVLGVGHGFVVYNPLESTERQLLRVIEECNEAAILRRHRHEREARETLLEIIFNRRVWTAFQPIVEMESRRVMAYEGLSRGPRGSELEAPFFLFGLAARHGLVDELERACRRQTFLDWEAFGAPGRLFLNTVPATVRDPSFLGRGVLDFLGARLSPRLVTLEINERQVIENLSLYREAMHAFLDLGFTFAIDDVGAGYSGLETIASLGATFLKIDMGLVRHVHEKRVNQQVVKAILEMGSGVGATVIAEGIETQEEAEALKSLGVRWGQGYLFGRPQDPAAVRPRQAVKRG